MVKTLQAELVLDAQADVGEGPTWDDRSGVLWWIDVIPGDVHRYDPATGEDTVFNLGQAIGTLAPRSSGGLLVALRDGFAAVDEDGGNLTWIAEVEKDQTNLRMNDGKCDRAGRMYAATMDFDCADGAGSLYRLDPDHTVTNLTGGLTIGNGLAWSADDTLLYYIDSLAGGIDVFDYEAATGELSGRRPFVKIPLSDGLPDGMCIDAEDHLWVAMWDGGVVRRYNPAGELDTVVEVPGVAKASCPAFGGPDLTDLYITTARRGLEPDELAAQPTAGGLFKVRPGVAGVPTNSFAG